MSDNIRLLKQGHSKEQLKDVLFLKNEKHTKFFQTTHFLMNFEKFVLSF